MPTCIQQLAGKFHAHITIQHDGKDFQIPKGWKSTIILLSRNDKQQVDEMITRHFFLGSHRNPDIESIRNDLNQAKELLESGGCQVLRVKLEHEDLPTLPPSASTYRECHVKYQAPLGTTLSHPDALVASSNPMAVHRDYEIRFLNARFYEGSVEEVDAKIQYYVNNLVKENPQIKILEVKRETTVMDSNHELDSWWA